MKSYFTQSGGGATVVDLTTSHYKIVEKIGQGDMGDVYCAEDTNLGRQVAIKVLPEQFTHDPERLSRFERETQLLTSLNYPNVDEIHGLAESDGVWFLALELVGGKTLGRAINRKAETTPIRRSPILCPGNESCFTAALRE